jgi:GAF domain-containing protein
VRNSFAFAAPGRLKRFRHCEHSRTFAAGRGLPPLFPDDASRILSAAPTRETRNLPDLNAETIALGRDERLRAMLRDICAATGMGFAAVARVTEQRWIACQVEDRIAFGLDPGGELKIHETICDEIRDSGEAIVIDDTSTDIKWSRHPVPVIYGFKSYCSFPVYLDDGNFFGTLCAIDPTPRRVSDEAIVELFSNYAKAVGAILSEALGQARAAR